MFIEKRIHFQRLYEILYKEAVVLVNCHNIAMVIVEFIFPKD